MSHKTFRKCQLKEIFTSETAPYMAEVKCPNPSGNGLKVFEKPDNDSHRYGNQAEAREALSWVVGRQACEGCKLARVSKTTYYTERAAETNAMASSAEAEARLAKARMELAKAQKEATELVNYINQSAGLPQTLITPDQIPTRPEE